MDDSTGVVRRFQHIILDEVPQLSDTGLSWYKLNSSDNNVLKDAFQFNYKQYIDSEGNVVNPYQYVVNTESTVDKTTKLPSGGGGGNWFVDIKTGVLFFPDFNNLSSSSNNDFKISSTNKPALTIYVYVGQKGISNFTAESSGSSFDNNVDLSLNAKLFVDNDVSFNGKLVVGGDVSFNGDLTINGNLEVYQQQNTSVINTTVNNYEVIITNDLSLNGNIAVEGDASFNRVDICGNLYAQYPDNSIPSSAIIGGVGSGSGSGSSETINNNGQKFYEVITQQPGEFTYVSSSNTTSSVTINWNYDDIIGNRIGTTERAFLTLFSGYQKYIPFIQKIYIDVSYGTVTNGWLNYKTLNFSGSTDYNQNAYKTNTFTFLSETKDIKSQLIITF